MFQARSFPASLLFHQPRNNPMKNWLPSGQLAQRPKFKIARDKIYIYAT